MEQTTLDDQNELKEVLTKYGFELSDIDYTNFKKITNETNKHVYGGKKWANIK